MCVSVYERVCVCVLYTYTTSERRVCVREGVWRTVRILVGAALMGITDITAAPVRGPCSSDTASDVGGVYARLLISGDKLSAPASNSRLLITIYTTWAFCLGAESSCVALISKEVKLASSIFTQLLYSRNVPPSNL